jgi:hypothetical protein
MKSGSLNFLEPSGPVQACNGTAFTFYESTECLVPEDRAVYKTVHHLEP